jgi:hypothetical protein
MEGQDQARRVLGHDTHVDAGYKAALCGPGSRCGSMDSSSSWIDVDTPAPSSCLACDDIPAACPMPIFRPNLEGPGVLVEPPVCTVSSMQQGLRFADGKAELHRVLQSIQCSNDFGIYFCESFRDPRRHYIDDYWSEIREEAIGVEELHRAVGRVDNTPLTDEARSRLHLFARLLDRLSRRIDRVVLA